MGGLTIGVKYPVPDWLDNAFRFHCDSCGREKLVSRTAWEAFQFSGLPDCCRKPMRRVEDRPVDPAEALHRVDIRVRQLADPEMIELSFGADYSTLISLEVAALLRHRLGEILERG